MLSTKVVFVSYSASECWPLGVGIIDGDYVDITSCQYEIGICCKKSCSIETTSGSTADSIPIGPRPCDVKIGGSKIDSGVHS